MPAEIHLLATAREAKGERPPLHLIDPPEPISLGKWVANKLHAWWPNEVVTPRAAGISEEAILTKNETALNLWFEAAVEDLGPEKVVSLLEAKVHLGKAILQARGKE